MLTRIFTSLVITAFLTAISLNKAIAASTMERFTSEVPAGLQSAAEAEAIISGARDGNLNKVIATSPTAGASASAIGNLVNVVVGDGSQNNSVVVNASQVNSGSQQATITSR